MIVALHVQRIGDAAEISQMLGLNFSRLLLRVAYPYQKSLAMRTPWFHSLHKQLCGVLQRTVGMQTTTATMTTTMRGALFLTYYKTMDYLVDAVCAAIYQCQAASRNPCCCGIFHRSNRGFEGHNESTTALLTEVVSTLLAALDREFQSQQ